jgi:hypothetical protein
MSALLGAPCLFLQSAAADVNPTTVTARQVDLQAWADQAMEHLKGLEDLVQPFRETPFRALTGILQLAYQPLPDSEVAERYVWDLERIAGGDVASPDLQETIRTFKNTMNLRPEEPLEPAKARFTAQALAEAGRKTLAAIQTGAPPSPQPLHLTGWRLGDFLLVFMAAEIFSATGQQIRQMSTRLSVLPVSCMAPLVGYLPDPPSISLGGYEVSDAWRFYGHPAPFAPDSEPRLLQQVAGLVQKLQSM